ncbi:FecCD family ABC transporter permease [Microbacterium esteraromaticum]|nr:iron chelate uptake ABC transporter family permease subunit [Microbacterium esteraromaticum]
MSRDATTIRATTGSATTGSSDAAAGTDGIGAAGTMERAPRSRALTVLRAGVFSALVRPRAIAVAGGLTLLVLLAAAVHLALGSTLIPLGDVLAAVFGAGDGGTVLIVQGIRLPRVAAALAAGLALGMSGAITQTIARNPLASPDVLGVTSGAALGAVAVLVLSGGVSGGAAGMAATVAMPLAALGCGLVAATITCALGWRGGIDVQRTVLAGIGVSWLATSLTTWLLTLGDVTNAAIATTWMSGSLNGREWSAIAPSVTGIVVLLVCGALLSQGLRLAAMDELTATGLGVRLGAVRLIALAVAVLLASLAALVAGPLSFIALAAPQIARLAARTPTPSPWTSACVGALLLIVADIITSRLFPIPLPAGVGTALVGVPYLIWLIISTRRRTAA